MPQLPVWVGAGLVSAGVSAALIAGAGAASAATDADSDSGGTTSSDSQRPSSSKLHAGPAAKPQASAAKPQASPAAKPQAGPAKPQASPAAKPQASPAAKPRRPDVRTDVRTKLRPSGDQRTTTDPKDPADSTTLTSKFTAKLTAPPTSKRSADLESAVQPVRAALPSTFAKQAISERFSRPGLGQLRLTATSGASSDVGGVIAAIGSAFFDALQAVETAVTGPPVVPPGSHVTVQSSTIQLDNGETVPANWYFPETSDGSPPQQMILLQHGFLAQGPMYSYTAAALAEQTGSIVVTPTLSSNPFAGDDYWLGGSGMAASVGHLYEGDRAAQTQSARDAGYESRYGLAPGTGELPKAFALMGHSLGANLVAGAAGTLAADCTPGDCAADDLVGVILLDGVPMGNTLPDALAELDAKEALTGYVPVREIGAPLNPWNFVSSVNEDLIAGFPEPQNPPAVETLSAQWLNDWFAGDTDNGDDLAPGTTVDVPTSNGTAHGVVIGTAPAPLIAWFHQLVTELETPAVTDLPSTDPTWAMLAA